ncbi:PREDICTED: uncharacterized protein C5orf34 homolog [Chaetura pelagica]|uniref:uncharacterized protein C5orf34 homolog n=1 Tax=Chaetura pelagica TaxID=8897 RepID=UPI0005233659|nr:PREDICTED: uncharacterized protein C5orf34 homolog [Chaetura pelagica]
MDAKSSKPYKNCRELGMDRTGAARPRGAPPLQPPRTTRQRVAFVLSAYREQLLRALDFRNKFSPRPYLPSRVIPPERKKGRLCEIEWCFPRGCQDQNPIVSPLKCLLEFLCKVSQSSAGSLSSSQKNSCQTGDQYGKLSRSPVAEMSSKEIRIENKKNEHGCAEAKYREPTKPKDPKDRDGGPLFYTNCSSEYTWVTQRWSVSSYPDEWKYPLSLALMWTFCDFFENEDTEKYSCPQLIKIVWCQGVFYRFIHGQTNITEIYPGDDTFFKSEGAFLGNYFMHYAIQKGSKKKEEKMYSVNSLPPDVPGNPYSVSSIIIQATKILQYCYKTKLSLTHNYQLCCWKMVPETDGREMLPVVLHEKVIPSQGRLVVYSDHKILAVFWDGTTLNMVWDFNSSCSEIQVNEGVGWCKLTTPDGVQQLIQLSHPGIYERYIRTAIEWCRSLNERKAITEYSAHSVTEEKWSADTELKKIQRFNCILFKASSSILQPQ